MKSVNIIKIDNFLNWKIDEMKMKIALKTNFIEKKMFSNKI
jgi:hypothetical protein